LDIYVPNYISRTQFTFIPSNVWICYDWDVFKLAKTVDIVIYLIYILLTVCDYTEYIYVFIKMKKKAANIRKQIMFPCYWKYSTRPPWVTKIFHCTTIMLPRVFGS